MTDEKDINIDIVINYFNYQSPSYLLKDVISA